MPKEKSEASAADAAARKAAYLAEKRAFTNAFSAKVRALPLKDSEWFGENFFSFIINGGVSSPATGEIGAQEVFDALDSMEGFLAMLARHDVDAPMGLITS